MGFMDCLGSVPGYFPRAHLTFSFLGSIVSADVEGLLAKYSDLKRKKEREKGKEGGKKVDGQTETGGKEGRKKGREEEREKGREEVRHFNNPPNGNSKDGTDENEVIKE